jgi:SIR2-like domain
VDFLQCRFEEELNEEGDVSIAGESFRPASILREMAPGAYKAAFGEWLQRLKQTRLERADEILAMHDNGTRFEQLAKAYRSGGMLPFVGAGMSVSSGYRAWTPFLFHLCNESHIESSVLEALVDAGDYEEAAQLLHDDMGAELFNESVEMEFAQSKDSAGPLAYLPQLFPNSSVLTTNFDCLLEDLYGDDAYQGFDRVLSGRGLQEVLRQIAGGGRLLVKLHGDCRQVEDRVLLRNEYTDAYSDAGIVERFFSSVIFGRAILFLGCSLSADRTVTTMKRVVAGFGAASLPRHYAFLELKDDDDRVARKKHLAKANIFPIWYEEGDHDESIEALFMKLLDESE